MDKNKHNYFFEAYKIDSNDILEMIRIRLDDSIMEPFKEFMDVYSYYHGNNIKHKLNEVCPEIIDIFNDKLKINIIEDWEDEHGHHPGYRSYETVPPLVDQISNCLVKYALSDIANEMAKEVTSIVLENIKNCKNYYRFDREEESFDCSIALGASPTSNPETVKQWWKENYNVDIEIEEHNPRLFWYRDMGYTDEDLAEEFNSENWKEIVDKEWEEEKEERKHQQEERIKEFQEKYGQK